MHEDIENYNKQLSESDKAICDKLALCIANFLTEAEGKLWHGQPVWFLDGNPIVGYVRQKAGIRLMFWSGADFGEAKLAVVGKKFKDASIFYQDVNQVDTEQLEPWLEKSRRIQWDYKNIVKRKGKLERLK